MATRPCAAAWAARLEARLAARGAHRAFAALETALRAARRPARAYRRARRAGVAASAAAHGSTATPPPARADRPGPRGLRRVLVPRLLVQPARDLREGARARPGHARRVGREAATARRAARRASSTSSPARREYYDVHGPRARTSSTTSTSPTTSSSAPGSVHLQTHHGTPLKQMGLDLQRQPGDRRADGLRRRCWSAARAGTTASPPTRSPRRSGSASTPARYETLETGYPRNDVLATATGDAAPPPRASARHRARAGAPCCTRRPTASTSTATCPRSTSPRLADALGPGLRACSARRTTSTTPTPRCATLHDAGGVRDVAAHPSVEELCLAADVLVTDYSSIMFDYAVLDRPIVIHAPDWEAYRRSRGAYFDLMAEPPGVGHAHRGRAGRGAARRRLTASAARAARRSGRASARSTTAAPPSASCAGSGSASACRPRRARRVADERRGRRGWSSSSASAAAARACSPASSASSASTSRSPRCRPTTPTRAGSASRAGWSTSTSGCCGQRASTVNDARPAAWEQTGAVADDDAVRAELRDWLQRRARRARDASWSRTRARGGSCRCGRAARDDLGVAPDFVTMLRHPAEILASATQVLRRRGRPRRAAPRPGST